MNVTDLVSYMSPQATATPVLQKTDGEDDATTSAIETTDTTSPEPTSTEKASEEFDTFLRLLTAQIKNQDPLAPLDSTQFVEQLATFSQLELQASTNQKLDAITQLLAQQGYSPNTDSEAA